MEKVANNDAPVDPRALKIIKEMSGDFADLYVDTFLVLRLRKSAGRSVTDEINPKILFEDAFDFLRLFFGHYAFARRGKERDELAEMSLACIDKALEQEGAEKLLKRKDGEILWELFMEQCGGDEEKANEGQNRGLIQGMLELMQEVYELTGDGSVPHWIVNSAHKTRRLEPQFDRIVDIRGVGPKTTSMILRDVCYYFDLEDLVDPKDLVYVQPVDRWLRLLARIIVPEPGMDSAADWVIAGKVAKYCRKAGYSCIRFNMGTVYFGQRIVRSPEKLVDELRNLLLGRAPSPLDELDVDEDEIEF